uniref:Uncharacterized protein n=1 Tax=Setaria viridis TaxID=4556 RepID=A0A4U6W4U9_SETVI|nr:hypothetical protein SEVIR_1G054800v2 [Setaria viridis]
MVGTASALAATSAFTPPAAHGHGVVAGPRRAPSPISAPLHPVPNWSPLALPHARSAPLVLTDLLRIGRQAPSLRPAVAPPRPCPSSRCSSRRPSLLRSGMAALRYAPALLHDGGLAALCMAGLYLLIPSPSPRRAHAVAMPARASGHTSSRESRTSQESSPVAWCARRPTLRCR